MTNIQRFGLRQLEWDKTEGDQSFGSANRAIDRHNREIESAYRLGYEQSKRDAVAKLQSMTLPQAEYSDMTEQERIDRNVFNAGGRD